MVTGWEVGAVEGSGGGTGIPGERGRGGGGLGCGDMGSGGAGGGGGPHGGGWRGICATSTLARLDALNCWMAACKA